MVVKSKVNHIESLLSNKLGANVDIVSQKTSFLTAPGEHYGSVMLQIELTVRKNNSQNGDCQNSKKSQENVEVLNLVAKLMPANEMLRVAFDVGVTFKKEVWAYNETIPTLSNFQRDFNIANSELFSNLFPTCYGARISQTSGKTDVDDDAVLLFENLKLQGYKTEDRLVGFDLDSTRIILRDLARFHATPIALKLRKPELFESKVRPACAKNKGLEQLGPEVGMAFHNAILEGAQEVTELEPFLARLQKVTDYALEHPFVDRPPPNEPWGTMVHSDFWVSNTMLLKDEHNKPISNKIVDLQLMTYTSSVRDLIFFLFTSVINDVLSDNYDQFIRFYHEHFIRYLSEFGTNLDISQFSWERFLDELNEVGPTEVYHVLVMLKPICTERGKVKNTTEEFQDSDWSRKDLLGPSHRRKLKDTVLALVERNWI